MKQILLYPMFLGALIFGVSACQEDYIMEIADKPTETIEFSGITVSRDTACMFDTIVFTANAKGENLKYIWQRTQGSMVSVKGEPDKVYFWGCQTCCGDLTISCTVENEFGAYSKKVNVFIYPWYSWEEPWPEGQLKAWLNYINNRK